MAKTTPHKMKVIHTGIIRMIVFVSSTSVTVQSFHRFFSCSSTGFVGSIMAALSKHLTKYIKNVANVKFLDQSMMFLINHVK